jgi:microcystin-dependent protein
MSFNINVPEQLKNDISYQDLYINGGITINVENDNIVEIKNQETLDSISINADVSLINQHKFIGNGVFHVNTIVMWSGDENGPGGCWALCDGDNETPDLRGKFIMSSTYSSTLTINGESTNYSLGQTDGKQYVTLEDEEMPSHSHHGDTQDSQHSHIIELGDYDDGNFTGNPGQFPPADAGTSKFTGGNWKTDSGGAHTHSYTTDSSGGDLAHENRPSYYVLAFIMRIF